MNISPIDIQKYLRGMNYPADKEALLSHAREEGAPEEILSKLEDVDDTTFETPADVMQALGGNLGETDGE